MPSVVIKPKDENAAYDDDQARKDWEEYERELRCEQNYYGLCWPYACKSCGGWGVHSWVEYYDEGPGEHMSEECPECLGGEWATDMLCPRCGWLLFSYMKHPLPCHACGWNYDDGTPSLA